MDANKQIAHQKKLRVLRYVGPLPPCLHERLCERMSECVSVCRRLALRAKCRHKHARTTPISSCVCASALSFHDFLPPNLCRPKGWPVFESVFLIFSFSSYFPEGSVSSKVIDRIVIDFSHTPVLIGEGGTLVCSCTCTYIHIYILCV